MENKCKKCYENDKTPDKNDCKKCQEVIINGIDVSRCEYYQIEANELYPKAQYCGSMRNTFCENEPNCYYKQLKRLEQKLEKIKGIVETALKANYCNNCDGVGIPECADYECHTYALDKVMNIIEGVEDE